MLKDKVIVVTGAGSGMGRELAIQLIERGAHVAGVDINGDTLRETKDIINDEDHRFSMHVADVTNHDDIVKLPNEVIEFHGRVDGIINNAGVIQPFVHFTELPKEKSDFVFNINLFGLLNLTREFLPHILKSEEGIIANTSSMGGFLPVPGQGIYGASKAAVKLFSEALYAELIDTNINVSVIIPGAINTNITKNSHVEGMDTEAGENNKMVLSADKAAKIILNGIEKKKLKILVGKDAYIMDKLYRLMPKTAIKMMANLINKTMHK